MTVSLVTSFFLTIFATIPIIAYFYLHLRLDHTGKLIIIAGIASFVFSLLSVITASMTESFFGTLMTFLSATLLILSAYILFIGAVNYAENRKRKL